jgi:hypothetical protein
MFHDADIILRNATGEVRCEGCKVGTGWGAASCSERSSVSASRTISEPDTRELSCRLPRLLPATQYAPPLHGQRLDPRSRTRDEHQYGLSIGASCKLGVPVLFSMAARGAPGPWWISARWYASSSCFSTWRCAELDLQNPRFVGRATDELVSSTREEPTRSRASRMIQAGRRQEAAGH